MATNRQDVHWREVICKWFSNYSITLFPFLRSQSMASNDKVK